MNSFLDPVELSLASKSLRFFNVLIDGFIIQILSYLPIIPFFYLYNNSETPFRGILILVFYYTIYILMYAAQEYLFKGRTIGKFVTGTKVVTLEGNAPEFKECLIRSLIRLVPFEAISFLGETGWHDAWSKTRVVSIKEFDQNKLKFSGIDQIGVS